MLALCHLRLAVTVACCGLGFGGRVWVCGGYCIGCRFAEWRSFVCALWRLCVAFTQDVSASVGGDSFCRRQCEPGEWSCVFGRVGVSARLWRVGVDGFETGSLGLAADGTVSLSSSDSVAVGGASVSVAGAEDVDISSGSGVRLSSGSSVDLVSGSSVRTGMVRAGLTWLWVVMRVCRADRT